jgi:xylulokinase
MRMEEEAAESPPGTKGLFFHPYLQGERSPYWDPSLRASFTGAAMSHTRGDFIRAIMEGVAFSLLDCRRIFDEMGLSITQLRLIGGGAKSALWSRIVCDVFGKELIRPKSCDASFGAALLAGVGAGVFGSEADAVVKCVKIKDTLSPDGHNHEKYVKLFRTYRAIHDSLSDKHRANP